VVASPAANPGSASAGWPYPLGADFLPVRRQGGAWWFRST